LNLFVKENNRWAGGDVLLDTADMQASPGSLFMKEGQFVPRKKNYYSQTNTWAIVQRLQLWH